MREATTCEGGHYQPAALQNTLRAFHTGRDNKPGSTILAVSTAEFYKTIAATRHPSFVPTPTYTFSRHPSFLPAPT